MFNEHLIILIEYVTNYQSVQDLGGGGWGGGG